MGFFQVTTIFFIFYIIHPIKCVLNEQELKKLLTNKYEKDASTICTKVNEAEWDYETDINNHKKEQIVVS